MPDALLGFRPVHTLHRLPRGSRACPLSSRHVLAAPGLPRRPLPFFVAPSAPALRGVLAAAAQARAVVGLRCPAALDAARWLDAAVRAADELAPGLPFVAAAEVALTGGDGEAVDRARLEVARLVEAGVTHLAVDAALVRAAERAGAAADAAAPASDRELGVELVLAPEDARDPVRAATYVGAVRDRRVEVDLARATAGGDVPPADELRALLLVARHARVGVARAGPLRPGVAALLGASPLHALDDGGAVLAAAVRARGDDRRAEALAWSEAEAFLDALGAAGSARALERGFGAEA